MQLTPLQSPLAHPECEPYLRKPQGTIFDHGLDRMYSYGVGGNQPAQGGGFNLRERTCGSNRMRSDCSEISELVLILLGAKMKAVIDGTEIELTNGVQLWGFPMVWYPKYMECQQYTITGRCRNSFHLTYGEGEHDYALCSKPELEQRMHLTKEKACSNAIERLTKKKTNLISKYEKDIEFLNTLLSQVERISQ